MRDRQACSIGRQASSWQTGGRTDSTRPRASGNATTKLSKGVTDQAVPARGSVRLGQARSGTGRNGIIMSRAPNWPISFELEGGAVGGRRPSTCLGTSLEPARHRLQWSPPSARPQMASARSERHLETRPADRPRSETLPLFPLCTLLPHVALFEQHHSRLTPSSHSVNAPGRSSPRASPRATSSSATYYYSYINTYSNTRYWPASATPLAAAAIPPQQPTSSLSSHLS